MRLLTPCTNISLRHGGYIESGLLALCERVVKECKNCRQYRRHLPMPPVAPPRDNNVLDEVAMDIAFLNLSNHGRVQLVLFIDVTSKFVSAELMPDRSATSILHAYFNGWPRFLDIRASWYLMVNRQLFAAKLSLVCSPVIIYYLTTRPGIRRIRMVL